MRKVLIVDDSRTMTSILAELIGLKTSLSPVSAGSFAEAREILQNSRDFVAAVVDYNLPDAPDGECINYISEVGIPVIVLTGKYDKQTRDKVIAGRVVDYIVKRHGGNLGYAVKLVHRLQMNPGINILVVDDSQAYLSYLQALLENHRYQVTTATSGEEALQILDKNPEIKLLITDFQMPGMNGMQLISKIRETRDMDSLIIIGLSAVGDGQLSAELLKSGANDFLAKPFPEEEFYCRVSQNIELIEHIERLRDISIRDPLTGLHNRRYLYSAGDALYQNAARGAIGLTAAMIDIDFFKKVNDVYGHQAGDKVICAVADTLSNSVRKSDVVVRYGGEEFCVLLSNMDPANVGKFFDSIRESVNAVPVDFEGQAINVSVSIGVSTLLGENLEAMLEQADQNLYLAKSSGRNCVMIDETQKQNSAAAM
ncbi:MAG: diguanylate cyclase [Gammaproteobacteria bacterium]|nr:diguanylate cyclase [Gammaproteobacteria bacterium]